MVPSASDDGHAMDKDTTKLFRVDLAEAFRADPFGDHGPELQALLRVMRTEPEHGKHVLYCTVPYREWILGRLRIDGRRRRIDLMSDRRYASREAAEWAVFKARWAAFTGRELDMPDDGPWRDAAPGTTLYGQF